MKKELMLSVLGSSRPRERDAPVYARRGGWEVCFAERGFTVYTAAYGGTMGAVSRGAKDGGGKTYGVTAELFPAAKAKVCVVVEVRVKTWQEIVCKYSPGGRIRGLQKAAPRRWRNWP